MINHKKPTSSCSRRDFLQTAAAATLATSISTSSGQAASPKVEDQKVFFGDLHTHTALSDGNGTPEENFEVARSHLDFWCMADHAFDEVVFTLKPGGVKRLHEAWPRVQELCRTYEAPGSFIPFLGYEWTSFGDGHHNVYYLRYDEPIRMPPSLPKMYEVMRSVDALVIPHHPGYPVGICGKDWRYHDEELSPFVEVYSTHGTSETPEGVQPILTLGSWMGPGGPGGCVQAGLARGCRVGMIASSDSHLNHPGAYDLGLMGVHAQELTRQSLWEAFKKKRVYAVTGDRINLDFSVNGHPMGSTIDRTNHRHIHIEAIAWDQIERVEVLKNNQLFHTFEQPMGSVSSNRNKRFRFLVEWGWDARGDHKWGGNLKLGEGRILQAIPCYRGNTEKCKGTGIMDLSASQCSWNSNAKKARYNGQARRYGDLIALEVECPEDEKLELTMTCDGFKQTLHLSPADILHQSKVQYMEDIPVTNDGNYWKNMQICAKFKIHKAWLTDQLSVALDFEDSGYTKSGGTDFYYVRLLQRNAQRAWSSPVWVEG